MPAFSLIYNDQQIADLASYLRATYSQRAPWTDVEKMAAKVRKENDAR
jgi:mono/diheme cytochrome c family protein